MSKSAMIYLIWELDGGKEEIEEVYAEIHSARQSEFAAAGQSGYTNWNGIDEITADAGKKIVIVEVDSNNIAVAVAVVISNANT